MSTESLEGFANNWAYLKAEIGWLDRILMLAIARYRQDKKSVDRIAQTKADRVSSHWWKGVISLDGKAAYDEHRSPSRSSSSPPMGYQQQLELQIQASRRAGTILALPDLCDRLGLTLFEKNLVLMGLAPEVNRRYARLYQYLQSSDAAAAADLPTVELALRLLCRSDQEWRAARNRLSSNSPLIQHGLVKLFYQPQEPFLSAVIRLAESLVDHLLADSPRIDDLERLLRSPELPSGLEWGRSPLPVHPFIEPSPELSGAAAPAESSQPDAPAASTTPQSVIQTIEPNASWTDLVVSASLLSQLQHLSAREQVQLQVDEAWGFGQRRVHSPSPGTITIFAGASGTGKTLAAHAIAHSLECSLGCVDLAKVLPADYLRVLTELTAAPTPVTVIDAAPIWLGQTSPLHSAQLHEFLAQRRATGGITILMTPQLDAIAPQWQHSCDMIASFPIPEPPDRLTLWKRAFPTQAPLDRRKIRWTKLSQINLTGGDIGAIAREAAIDAATEGATTITMDHLRAALHRRGQSIPSSGPRSGTRDRTRLKNVDQASPLEEQ